MKVIISILLLQAGMAACAQKTQQAVPKAAIKKPAVRASVKSPVDSVYTKSEIEAAFKGSFNRFLEDNLRYPPEVQEAGFQGMLYMKFIVDTNGMVSNIQVDESSSVKHPALVKEFTRLYEKSSGKWEPAIVNGRKVKSWHVKGGCILLQEEE
jgi:Na+-translocating ferredoxin:NAD+ oxidoreductase RnfG subunit